MSRKIKYAVLTFALAAVVAVSAAMSACTISTKHPRAKINVSFNDVTYSIEYTLYRNMYPQTVKHFIELADEGFYNDMIIHNYNASTDWFTGGYGYNTGDLSYETAYSNGTLAEYLETNSKEGQYYKLFNDGKLTPSVYKRLSYGADGKESVDEADALPTLIGEFPQNDHVIKNGALSASLGCLKMFYYDKGETNQKVAIENSFGQLMEHDYQYNCATSVFAMQMGGSSSYNASKYCVFGQLRNDGARDVFDELLEAISDYTASVTSTKFTTSIKTNVDNLDTFAEDGGKDIEVSFTLTAKPLIIKSVEITKY